MLIVLFDTIRRGLHLTQEFMKCSLRCHGFYISVGFRYNAQAIKIKSKKKTTESVTVKLFVRDV